MRKTRKKVYSTKVFFIKVLVEQDAPSLKKNVSATNFYETIKATISKSRLGASFSIAIFLWNFEISHFLLKTFADIKLNMWNEREWFIWTYMHILKILAILKNTWREAATMRSSLNICNYTENGFSQSYLRKMLLRGLSLLFSNCRCVEPWGTSFWIICQLDV